MPETMGCRKAFTEALEELRIKIVFKTVNDKLSVLFVKGKFETFSEELETLKKQMLLPPYKESKLADGPFILIQVAKSKDDFVF